MPSRNPSKSKGPALTFDPHYVDYVIAAWHEHEFAPISLADLEKYAAAYAEKDLTARNEMGLLEEEVSPAAITRAIGLLKALKLAKQTQTGPKGAKVARIMVLGEGRATLSEPPATGGLRPRLVRLLIMQSPELTELLRGFDQGGDLIIPAAVPADGAPRKGAAYNRAIEAGLAVFAVHFGEKARMHTIASAAQPAAKKPTAKQQLDTARARAIETHPAGHVKKLDKLLPLAATLGLVWTDMERINDVLVATRVGLAARSDGDGYMPNAPTWEEIAPTFLVQLEQAQQARADSTGFATIEALRGTLGRALHLSAAVVDALICHTREAGERGESSILVHFEEDEERMYVAGRDPLVWRGHAFDFVEVKATARINR